MICNETLFEVITGIEAYASNDESDSWTMSLNRKNVSEDSLGLSGLHKMDVPLKAKSCSFSEKENIDIAGESYEVTLNWQIQSADNSTYGVLDNLKEMRNHLILRTYGECSYFIRSEEEGYRFSYMEKEGLIECELIIHNRSGVQRII